MGGVGTVAVAAACLLAFLGFDVRSGLSRVRLSVVHNESYMSCSLLVGSGPLIVTVAAGPPASGISEKPSKKRMKPQDCTLTSTLCVHNEMVRIKIPSTRARTSLSNHDAFP